MLSALLPTPVLTRLPIADSLQDRVFEPGLWLDPLNLPAGHEFTPSDPALVAYHLGMNELVINVTWEYFLGILGAIIALAYYASSRFTRLETNMEWLSDVVRDLAIRAENTSTKLFDTGSPVSLTFLGHMHLHQSGLKSYIDRRRIDLLRQLRTSAPPDLYSVQDAAFRLMARIAFEQPFARRLHTFAYKKGVSTDLLRRAAAIYLRDLATGRA